MAVVLAPSFWPLERRTRLSFSGLENPCQAGHEVRAHFMEEELRPAWSILFQIPIFLVVFSRLVAEWKKTVKLQPDRSDGQG